MQLIVKLNILFLLIFPLVFDFIFPFILPVFFPFNFCCGGGKIILKRRHYSNCKYLTIVIQKKTDPPKTNIHNGDFIVHPIQINPLKESNHAPTKTKNYRTIM